MSLKPAVLLVTITRLWVSILKLSFISERLSNLIERVWLPGPSWDISIWK